MRPRARAGTAASFPQADEDYFHDMDGGVALTPDEIKGRNMWLVWTGGNDRFWDTLTQLSFGDLRSAEDRLVASRPEVQPRQPLELPRPGQRAVLREGDRPRSRSLRPVARRARSADCPPDPFENETKYPGVAIGARGKTVAGRLVLRLRHRHRRPAAVSQSGLRRSGGQGVGPGALLQRSGYYNDKDLVRPYRVGMSCGFCHVGPSPVKPPADPENPKWANLSSNVGAQYFWVDRIFAWRRRPEQLHRSSSSTPRGPGTLDTSLVSTDNINNPRTMNAVYDLAPRLGDGHALGQGDARRRRARQQAVQRLRAAAARSPTFFQTPDTVLTPHVLKDGADSVGALGALNRVYLNIGLFSEEWLLHFNAAGRRQADHADRDRGRARRTRLLAGDRGADAGHGAVLPEGAPRRTS